MASVTTRAEAPSGTVPFAMPLFRVNPGGWGPTTVPEEFKDMPFAPFDKGARLGKCADFAGVTTRSRATCAWLRDNALEPAFWFDLTCVFFCSCVCARAICAYFTAPCARARPAPAWYVCTFLAH